MNSFKLTSGVRALSWVVLLAAGLQSSTVLAQDGWPGQSRATETEQEGYILRANAYQSEYLTDEMASKYDVEQDENRGVLHIVVLEGGYNGDNATVEAEVKAQQQNLVGQLETVDMRKIETDNYISYLGTFNFDENAGFRFSISAEPEPSSEVTLSVEFEDSFHLPR